MKSIIIMCLFGVAAVAYAKPNEHYTTRYDNVDVEKVLKNVPLFNNYFKCIMDEGPCTPEGKEMRSHITEGLEQNCAKCTEPQRAGVRRVMGYMINERPELWERLKAKYDSTGKYSAKYESDLRKLKA